MFSANQRDEFDRRGFVRLPGAIPKADVDAMLDRVWDALASLHGVHRDAPETWTVPQPRGFKTLERSGAFESVGNPMVREALDELLGRNTWRTTWRWGHLLAKFSVARTWDVPYQAWHLDSTASVPAGTLPGVTLFTFLASVSKGGGGTLVVEGSHRLVEDLMLNAKHAMSGRSRDIRKKLMRAVPWLRDLWSRGGGEREERFMNEGVTTRGVDLRVVELTGEPGDVILMNPLVFHTAAPNRRADPRLMLVDFITVS
jgi:hypothetical protein